MTRTTKEEWLKVVSYFQERKALLPDSLEWGDGAFLWYVSMPDNTGPRISPKMILELADLLAENEAKDREIKRLKEDNAMWEADNYNRQVGGET